MRGRKCAAGNAIDKLSAVLFDYDILIAGAGPAGCAAAYDLAQGGQRVLLLDRRNFPRPKACACGLTRKTLKALRYSVDPIIERVCHEIVLQQASPLPAHISESRCGAPALSPVLPSAEKSREVRVRTRTPICAMAVRERFDQFCLDQTLAAGHNGGSVSLLKIESILSPRELPTHIELDIATAAGSQTLSAPVLIGADGSNGQTRRFEAALHPTTNLSSRPESAHFADAAERPAAEPSQSLADPAWYTRGFALEATVPYTALPAQLPAGDAPHDLVFDFAPLPGGYGWLFPKGDHINIGVGAFAPPEDGTAPQASLKQVTRALLSVYCQQKLGITALPDGSAFHVSGQHLGMGGHHYVPQGRILLVGDAAGLVDPLTGEGIHSAIVSGQAAAAAILATARPKKNPGAPTLSAAERIDSAIKADEAVQLATAYAKQLRTLQQTLAFSHRAARAFYKEPERGFRAMRIPILRSLILKTYADGLPHTRLLTALAKLV
jgi:flavin-dependent dehydrogenase